MWCCWHRMAKQIIILPFKFTPGKDRKFHRVYYLHISTHTYHTIFKSRVENHQQQSSFLTLKEKCIDICINGTKSFKKKLNQKRKVFTRCWNPFYRRWEGRRKKGIGNWRWCAKAENLFIPFFFQDIHNQSKYVCLHQKKRKLLRQDWKRSNSRLFLFDLHTHLCIVGHQTSFSSTYCIFIRKRRRRSRLEEHYKMRIEYFLDFSFSLLEKVEEREKKNCSWYASTLPFCIRIHKGRRVLCESISSYSFFFFILFSRLLFVLYAYTHMHYECL